MGTTAMGVEPGYDWDSAVYFGMELNVMKTYE